MTEISSEAITVTDAQVDSFFESGGKELDSQPETESKPVKSETNPVKTDISEEKSQPEVAVKDDKTENKVNYGALHEERMRRKEASERAKKAEERATALEEQLKRYAQPKQDDLDDDPIEAVRRENRQIKEVLIAQANKALADNENQTYWGKVAASEIAFKQDKPDFDDAAKFLAETRIEELKDLGWSESEAQKVLSDEIKWISDKAYADEVNPAERFYNLAMRRGFKAASQEQPIVDNSVNEKLDRIEKGMKTNRALPPASKSVKQDLTAEDLADMNVDALSNLRGETEFDKIWKKVFGT